MSSKRLNDNNLNTKTSFFNVCDTLARKHKTCLSSVLGLTFVWPAPLPHQHGPADCGRKWAPSQECSSQATQETSQKWKIRLFLTGTDTQRRTVVPKLVCGRKVGQDRTAVQRCVCERSTGEKELRVWYPHICRYLKKMTYFSLYWGGKWGLAEGWTYTLLAVRQRWPLLLWNRYSIDSFQFGPQIAGNTSTIAEKQPQLLRSLPVNCPLLYAMFIQPHPHNRI